MTQTCYHCDERVPAGTTYQTVVLGEPRVMCCPGCAAVASAIVDGGMEDYYRFRTEKAAQADEQELLNKLDIYDDVGVQQEFVVDTHGYKSIQLTVEGINCAACAWLIEKQFAKTQGVQQIAVNVAARRATLRWDDQQLSLSAILRQFKKIGYKALPFQPDQHEASYRREKKAYLRKLGLAGLMTMQVMMLAFALYFDWFGHFDNQTKQFFHWISLLLCTPIVVYAANGFYSSAWHALKAKRLNMDVPVSIAVIGAYSASVYATITEYGPVYFESVAMFVFLLLISRYLEHQSRHRAAETSANSMKHVPLTALKYIDGEWTTCLARQLVIGDRILVKAGETVATDGIIIEGNSELDESMLTGEFEPVRRIAGDTVLGGTLNHQSTLVVEVTSELKNAVVSQILHMQEMAMAQRPKIAGIADRISGYFVAVVLVIAAGAFIYWYQTDPIQAFYIAIAVLVGTCPCALGLATPTALTSAVANLNARGILIKRGDTLESLNQIRQIAVDKTGTLTEGRFSIKRVYCENGNAQQVIGIAAALEQHSEHPIAKAFDAEVAFSPAAVTITTGAGIEGYDGDDCYRIGSANFVTCAIPQSWQTASVFLTKNDTLIAAFELNDVARSDAQDFIHTMVNMGLSPIMLSGDKQQNVASFAQQLGIQQWQAECSPQQKLAEIRRYQQDNPVMMVGDGINDAPVMSAARVSVTLSAATDLAKNAADVILLQPKLMLIPHLMHIAQRCQIKIKQNIGWALGYNILVLPLAVTGILTPWMAALGMSLSSVIVVTNSLRLIKKER